jgi:DNA modification methylase
MKNSITYKSITLSTLKETVGNPQVMTESEFKGLRKSIREKGFILDDPVVWEYKQDKYQIISGHHRIRAASLEGIKKLKCKIIEGLTKAQAEMLVLEANQRRGELDDKLLNEYVYNLTSYDDVDIDTVYDYTGLADTDINLDSINKPTTGDDEVPEVDDKDVISKKGDLWELGRHRMLCGDCTDTKSVEKLTGGVKADMVFTDPPYGVNYSDKNKFLNSIDKGNRNQTPIKNDKSNIEELKNLWSKAFLNCSKILKDYSCYYIMSPQGADLFFMMMMMNENNLPARHNLVWKKNNHVLGRSDYNYKHEPILYGWSKKHKFYGKGEQKTSVWEFDKPLKSDLHPTMKPIALIENAILNSSLKNMIVADLFLGSGSTLIACEKTDRICYGMEIDEHYTTVIIKRYAKFMLDNNKPLDIKLNDKKYNPVWEKKKEVKK